MNYLTTESWFKKTNLDTKSTLHDNNKKLAEVWLAKTS